MDGNCEQGQRVKGLKAGPQKSEECKKREKEEGKSGNLEKEKKRGPKGLPEGPPAPSIDSLVKTLS